MNACQVADTITDHPKSPKSSCKGLSGNQNRLHIDYIITLIWFQAHAAHFTYAN